MFDRFGGVFYCGECINGEWGVSIRMLDYSEEQKEYLKYRCTLMK